MTNVIAPSLLYKPDLHAQGELSFRQSPTFKDCYPGSEKCYTEIEHNGSTLRVGAEVSDCFGDVALLLLVAICDENQLR